MDSSSDDNQKSELPGGFYSLEAGLRVLGSCNKLVFTFFPRGPERISVLQQPAETGSGDSSSREPQRFHARSEIISGIAGSISAGEGVSYFSPPHEASHGRAHANGSWVTFR